MIPRGGLIVAIALAATAAGAAGVSVDPPTLPLAPGVTARIAAPAGARVSSSVGSVRGDVLDPGGRRAPGYAIVAAALGAERSAAVVRLVGVGALPTHTSPGALVSVRIGDQTFGPVVADRTGDAAVPVEVPPEAIYAVVEATEPGGLTTTSVVPLPVAPFPPALVIAPAEIEVGTRTVVTMFAVTVDGRWRPIAATPPSIVAGAGLRIVGVPFAVAAGRWDVVVEGAEPADATITVSIDGAPLGAVPVRAFVRAPAPPRPDWTLWLGLRAGGGSAFGGAWAVGTFAEACVLGRNGVGVALELGAGRAAATTFYGEPRDVAAFYASVLLALRVRVPVDDRWAVWLGGGAGIARAASAEGTDVAPVLDAAAGLGIRAGPGEVVLELRWVDARFDDFAIGIEGNPMGAFASMGYRVEW